MTILEIKTYLRKYGFMVFRYDSEYYSLKRSQSLHGPQYSLIATDTQPHSRKSLEELCKQVCICEGILLYDVIKSIDAPEWNDPSWESYEAVRHCAIVYGNEIMFSYHGKRYWIAQTVDGLWHLSDDSGNNQWFTSCHALFEDARVEGSTLKGIWGNVAVETC